MSEVQYRYVQFLQRDGSIGYAAVAFDNPKSKDGENDELDYRLGIAFCSPKDSFVKRIGRAKAEHRYIGKRTKKPFIGKAKFNRTIKGVSNKEFWGILISAIESNRQQIPKWALRSFERGDVVLTTSPINDEHEMEQTDKCRHMKNIKLL